MSKRKAKTEKIGTLKAVDLLAATRGRVDRSSGCGAHADKRQRRQRTRAAARRAALRDW